MSITISVRTYSAPSAVRPMAPHVGLAGVYRDPSGAQRARASPRPWIDTVHQRRPPKIIILDMDSSESPTYGEQEGSAYNGHFGCTCYHPLFVFNQFGDVERCVLRPGNVHSADGWRAVLEPVIARYRGIVKHLYFRGDAAFANPEVYELLEAEGASYAIRLPANQVLQDKIGYLLKRPVGRPPHEVRRYYASFRYQAQSWNKSRHVVAKVEWHPGELYPRGGFIVTNLARSAEGTVAFYNRRGTCEQYIKEGKNAIKWTRLSCRTFAANAVRLQLHMLAYNLGNFMRTLAMPKAAKLWSLTSLREKLVKIGAKVVSHGRYVAFQMAEVRCRGRCSPIADRPATGTARAGMSGARSSAPGSQGRGMPWCKQIGRASALRCFSWRPQSPFARGESDLPLQQPVRSAMLIAKPPVSGEYRLKAQIRNPSSILSPDIG